MKLKFITLNLYQGKLLDAACAFLEQEKPDIVTLQEVYDGRNPQLEPRFRTLQILKERLGFSAVDYEAALMDNRKEGRMTEGNTILSSFPIVARDTVFFNDPFRDDYVEDIRNNPTQPHVLQHVVLQTPAGDIHVYNLHGTWDLDGDHFSEKRRQMSEAIIAAIKDKTKVILAGDTNAKPTNQAMRAIEAHLTSVFGQTLQSTFNMRHKTNPGYATAAVDMIFVSPEIKVIAKSCPAVDISDHLPLVAILEIPEINSQKAMVK